MKSTDPLPNNNLSPVDAIDAATQIVVMLATAYVAVRSAVGPDTVRTVQVMVFRYAEDYCQRRAMSWAFMADACKNAYDRTRLVA